MGQIVVTGATGQLGGLVIRHLLSLGVEADNIKGIVRSADKGAALKELGVQTVQADYDDPASLVQAFAGASKLLFVSGSTMDDIERIRQHANVVEAARNAGVGHILYTSLAFAESIENGLAKVHLATEFMIRTTNIPFTFLRNAIYMEALVNESLQGNIAQGELVTSAPTGLINYVTRNNLALAAAVVLTQEGHDNKTYELVNPNPFSFDKFAALLSEVSGQPVKHRTAAPEDVVKSMIEAGVPEGMAGITVYGVYAAIEDGQFGRPSEDLVKLIGDKFTNIQTVIRQVL
ncbi:SDR family oxidoreductase [Peribacillus asahii]|uniref:SDR family oxidoreductase n=1 Tax=Peribacillus asahii TaxID=228899 RepID=UPI00382FB019